MSPDDVLRTIAAGETLAVEFKGEERTALNDRDLVKTVVCLANRSGNEPAYLLVGVEDDGSITGARPRHGDATDPDKLVALIANQTRPSVAVRIARVELDGPRSS